MFGILLSSAGALFAEISSAIGKAEIDLGEENKYAMVFLNLIWAEVGFLGLVLLGQAKFVFLSASLPFFVLRAVLEVVQVELAVRALILASRSTFSFLRIVTIPLLLGVDLLLGYHLSEAQLGGILILSLALAAFFLWRRPDRRGGWIALASGVNAVLTITLFKFDISHFNSVAGEQIVMLLFLMAYCFGMSLATADQNPFSLLRRRIFVAQSSASAAASVVDAYAYMFAPASVIVAAGRSASIFWAVLSGSYYFKEKHLFWKLAFAAVLVSGIVLLAAQ